MGRRCHNKYPNNNVGNHISKGNSDTRLNDDLKNTHTRRRIVSVSKGNKITQEANQSIPLSSDIFPSWLPWILFPLTLLIRLLYVLEPTNWWILHPDEIFQTMEGTVFL